MVVTVAGRVPPWRRPSHTSSPAELGFAGKNLPLGACDVGAFGVVYFVKAPQGFPATFPLRCSISCNSGALGCFVGGARQQRLGWLPELVVFASCGVF